MDKMDYPMKQEDLPFQRHSVTSREAADSMKGSAKNLRTKVFEYIRSHGPASDEDIQLSLGMNPSTERPRRIELLRAGKIVECGETTTSSGRKAKVWKVLG